MSAHPDSWGQESNVVRLHPRAIHVAAEPVRESPVSIYEVMRYFGKSRSTIYNWINEGPGKQKGPMPADCFIQAGATKRFFIDRISVWLADDTSSP